MKHVLAFATFLTLVLANPLAQKGTKTVACYCEPPICPLELIAECKCKNYAAQECYKDWVSQGVACPSPTPSPCEAVLARAETPTPTPTSTTGPIYCGGFAGLGCPEGYACIDDISDDCDPNNGGADCIGICSWPETP